VPETTFYPCRRLPNTTDRLSLIGTYAYTDAEITKDNSGNEGKGLIGAARHSGSLWAKV